MLDLLKSLIIKVKDIAYKLGLISDYVVEWGTSGIWTYRKWNSGIAECWCRTIVAGVNYSTSFWGGYEGKVATLTFPSGLFETLKYYNVITRTSNGNYVSYTAADVTGLYVEAINSASGSRETMVCAEAKGLWKALGG